MVDPAKLPAMAEMKATIRSELAGAWACSSMFLWSQKTWYVSRPVAYDALVDSCQALARRSLMRSCSSSGSRGHGLGLEDVCAGSHRRSLSAAEHAGRRGEGDGVRSSGYLFMVPWGLFGGRGAFHLLVIREGDWLFETCGASLLSLAEFEGSFS